MSAYNDPREVYTKIRNRFGHVLHLDFGKHVKHIGKVSDRLEVGFWFSVNDKTEFMDALRIAGFQQDMRERRAGAMPSVGTFAALATDGEGFREPGPTSLHVAVGSTGSCQVHMDNFGFRTEHNYGPDAVVHIFDELLWPKVFDWVRKGSVPLATLMSLVHIDLPNSKQFNPYTQAGVQFDLVKERSKDLTGEVRFFIDASVTCVDAACQSWDRVDGSSVRLDNRLMLRFEVRR